MGLFLAISPIVSINYATEILFLDTANPGAARAGECAPDAEALPGLGQVLRKKYE